MTGEIEWQIPPSILQWLDKVPADKPVAMLIRHSVRGQLPPGREGYSVPITKVGEALATDLGRILGTRLQTLHASPLPRCVQTVKKLRIGAGVRCEIQEDRLLGDPGVYVLDGKAAWANWQNLGHERVMECLVSRDSPLPGMAAPEPAARYLVGCMLGKGTGTPGIHAFVTHDSLVTATAARFLGVPLGKADWPWYLEAAFFWVKGEQVHIAYRDHDVARLARFIHSLDESGVVELARRETALTLSLECPARFFLAGGAFKSLLTGLPPRDLDVWAPSTEDREALMEALIQRGAKRIPSRPFGEAYEIHGRIVEIPNKTEPDTLEGRLGQFDIALSAVGVEHGRDGSWRPVLHPLALESVRRRQILLLKPLVNWKYALSTLERMRKYAQELDFEIPPEEEEEVWRVFDAQDRTWKEGMLARFERSSKYDYGVREEAMYRLR